MVTWSFSSGKTKGRWAPQPAPAPAPSPTPPPDTVIPQVAITNPADGYTTTSSSVVVDGTASDDIGVAKVEVQIDGGVYNIASTTSAGWATWSIGLSNLLVGTHKIQARVTDTSGNQYWDSVNISVVAPAPAPTPTPSPVISLSDTFDTAYTYTSDGQRSPDNKWYVKYLSGGSVKSANGYLTIQTASATVSTSTYSIIVLSTAKFKDFKLELDMTTVNQRRINTAPKVWETAWVMWRYTDELPRSTHHYYFLLKTDGYEFGKKDNAPLDLTAERQVFLKYGSTPHANIGQTYHITVTCVGYHITIQVDGATIVDMVDPQVYDPSKMVEGLIGLYCEDSTAKYDNVKLYVL